MTKRTASKRTGSPTLQLKLAAEQHERAIRSNSGGCLIADAIKQQYPHLSAISVDMATIRVSDRAKGLRYTYLTPSTAQHVLLAFDQGWRNPIDTLEIRRAVKIDQITTNGRPTQQKRAQQREERLEELQLKLDSGDDLTPVEKRSLSRMTNPKAPASKPSPPTRPTARGPISEVITPKGKPATVVGGTPIPQGPSHPNLLRGRNRLFGAKIADPGVAFQEALDQAIADHFAEYDTPKLNV